MGSTFDNDNVNTHYITTKQKSSIFRKLTND